MTYVACATEGAAERREVDGVPLAVSPRPLSGREPLAVPPGRYDWAYLLAGADRDVEAEVHLHYAGGVDPELVLVPATREPALVRVPVPRHDELRALRLPEGEDVRVLALTLAVAREETAA